MDKPQSKGKSKKFSPKTKTTKAKKRKSDGQTCSTFLHDLTRKFALKRRLQEEEPPKNIVQTIVSSISNAMPVKFSKKSLPMQESMETSEPVVLLSNEIQPLAYALENIALQSKKPEPKPEDVSTPIQEKEAANKHGAFKIPRMPLVSSDVHKKNQGRGKKQVPIEDASVNTAEDRDVASELAKHVGTLRKISLIAEEFNQKTAKNLKEIVDSVQEDLLKKLEEVQARQKATISMEPHQEITEKD